MDRPLFSPICCTGKCLEDVLVSESGRGGWIPIIQCPADFPSELFETAFSQLIHHPEYNSTLILRSEVLSDSSSNFPGSVPDLNGFHPVRNIHRKLLPRRPGRDAGLEQHCTSYASSVLRDDDCPTVLVLTPLVSTPGASLPYYHPTVYHLAFRYITGDVDLLRIELVPLPGTPTSIDSRIYRTCLALLDTLHRYGWGAVTNYKKRVHHDCIIPREQYQDLYLVMRERHKHLVNSWQEVTDPLKHVFEDIGIATFLILLWKHTFGPEGDSSNVETLGEAPWKRWPRPPAGFLDLGCGNGLLTHILTEEGYAGRGIDLRPRTSWSHYPQSTQNQLQVDSLDPTSLSFGADHSYLLPGVFIIANHADELTPWTPVLATLFSASGYLSIPCCSWAFDEKYDRANTPDYPFPDDSFVEGLNLGAEGSNKSSYSRYRIWLASLSAYCGWEVECDSLRIPSTRNWAVIGRKRTTDSEGELQAIRENIVEVIQHVHERGLFKTRPPEGKGTIH